MDKQNKIAFGIIGAVGVAIAAVVGFQQAEIQQREADRVAWKARYEASICPDLVDSDFAEHVFMLNQESEFSRNAYERKAEILANAKYADKEELSRALDVIVQAAIDTPTFTKESVEGASSSFVRHVNIGCIDYVNGKQTKPVDLSEFMTWAKSVKPKSKYAM